MDNFIDPDYDVSFLFENDLWNRSGSFTYTDMDCEITVNDDGGNYIALMDITFTVDVSWVDEPSSFEEPGGIYDVEVNSVIVDNVRVIVDENEVIIPPERFIRRVGGSLIEVKPNNDEYVAARHAFDSDSVNFQDGFRDLVMRDPDLA